MPTVIIEPVEILETIVERATGNNAKWILDRNIHIGSRVIIEKKNEIIPAVVEVLS